uniref:Uncharacterized protein n=1 Tax=Triticum aestivum TaxID=4565 RepID=A0A3B6AYG0_WHEAT
MGGEPVAVSAMIPEALGKSEERALILGWAYYLYAFSSYPLRTWLPSVYRRHDNWYTRGAGSPHLHRHVYFIEPLSETVPRWLRLSCGSELTRGNLCTPLLPFGRPTPHRNCLLETVPWPAGLTQG